MIQTYVVVYYPASGSSWLTGMLVKNPRVWSPGYEPLEPWHWEAPQSEKLAWVENLFTHPGEKVGERPDLSAWIDRVLAAPEVKGEVIRGATHVGFKMTDDAIQNWEPLFDLFLKRRSKLIFLHRQNRVKHALSLYRSYEEKKNQFQGRGVMDATTLDLALFHKWLGRATMRHTRSVALRDKSVERLGADNILTVYYEHFAEDVGKPAVVEALAGFLDLEAHRMLGVLADKQPAAPPGSAAHVFRKATSDRLSESIANYEEVRGHFDELVNFFDSSQ